MGRGAAFWLRSRLRQNRLLLACILTLLVASLHDLLLALPWRMLPPWFQQVQLKYRFFAAHYAAPLVLLLLTRNIAQRFVQSLTATETLNRELESPWPPRRRRCKSYARRAQMEREGAAHAERERIHRDLHDDIGAMLLSLTLRAKDAQDADLARSALRSLRDVVSHSGSRSFRFPICSPTGAPRSAVAPQRPASSCAGISQSRCPVRRSQRRRRCNWGAFCARRSRTSFATQASRSTHPVQRARFAAARGAGRRWQGSSPTGGPRHAQQKPAPRCRNQIRWDFAARLSRQP